MLFKSSLPDVVISEIPVGTRILEKILSYGDRVALVNADNGKKFTYSQIKNDIMEISATLWSLGVRKGHVVMLVVPFDPKYISLLIAIATCGAIINFSYLHEDPEAMTSHIDDLKPFLIVTEYPNLTKFKVPRHVLTLTQIRELKLTLDPERRMFLDGVIIDVHKDPIVIFNSSGTTGKSKGIVFTHFAINAVIDQRNLKLLNQLECILLIIPVFHFASMMNIFKSLYNGIKLVATGSITLPKLYEVVKEHGVSLLKTTYSPVLMELINRGKVPELESLKWVSFGGMPFPDHMIEKAKTELCLTILPLYASTETGIISVASDDNCPAGSVGKLLSNVQVRIIDPSSGAQLKVGEPGEILVKSPSMMKEYLKPEGDDRFANDSDGWFHTGDIGYFDQSGFLYIIDRIKNVIKGVWNIPIFPAVVEKILLKHLLVKDAAVIRVRHPKYLETPKAFVVRENDSANADEILSFYNNQVPDFKQIHGGLEFIEVIPRVGLGKIDRNELRKIHNSTSCLLNPQ